MKIKSFITMISMVTMLLIKGYSQTAFATPLDIDMGFGVNGTAVINLIPDQDGDVHHISTGVTANNKVVTLSGIKMFNTGRKIYALAGFDELGNPDPAFGVSGKVILSNLYLSHHEAHEMVVQADGKIIVVGRANTHVSGSEDIFAARYLANGSLDTNYGNNGIATRSLLPWNMQIIEHGIHAVTQSDGRVIVATNVILYGNDEDIFLFRFGSNGSSSSFNGGYVFLPGKGIVMDMDVDNQNRVVVVGGYTPPGSYVLNEKIFVARFTASLIRDDNDFSPNCIYAGSYPCAYTVVDVYDTHPNLINQQFINSNYQMDVALKKPYGSGVYNKIVVSGSFGIIRLNENGTEDNSFNANGRVQSNLQFVDSVTPGYNYVEIRSDEKIASLNTQSSTLALYDTDGQLALECTGGISSVDIPNQQTIAPTVDEHSKNYSMKIDSNNRIVQAGAATVLDDDFNMDIEAVFAERYQRRCPLILEPKVEGDPTDKLTIRDVHPFVHPQEIVGPNWKNQISTKIR